MPILKVDDMAKLTGTSRNTCLQFCAWKSSRAFRMTPRGHWMYKEDEFIEDMKKFSERFKS